MFSLKTTSKNLKCVTLSNVMICTVVKDFCFSTKIIYFIFSEFSASSFDLNENLIYTKERKENTTKDANA